MTRLNPQTSTFTWGLDGGTAYNDYYRTYQNGRVLVVGVEGRNRPQPHQIISFGVFDGETRTKIVEGPVRQHTFQNVQEALNFAENWFLSNCLTPMELMSQGLTRVNPDVPKHTWRLFTQPYKDINQWSVMIGDYRARVHVRRFDDNRYVIYRLDLQRKNHEDFRFKPADLETTYASEEEALAAAEEWIYSQLTPMEILALTSVAKDNPSFRLPFSKGAFATFYQARHKNHHVSVWFAPGEHRINRCSVLMFDTEGNLLKETEGPSNITFQSLQDALDYCSDWYASKFMSPMELLGLGMDKKMNKNRRYALSNPFLLDFKYPTTVFGGYTHEAQHQRRTISLRLEPSWPSPTQKMYRLAIFRIVGPPPDYIYGHGPTGALFKTEEEAFEFVSAWYADKYLSPMELLGLGLTAKENPRYLVRRNPQLSWTKTDEVHRHGSDGISRLIVYETQYDQTRWLRLDLSEHDELNTPYYLVDDAYIETPEGTIWLGREFKADFDTEDKALEHFENYFFTHFTSPMEMLSAGLKQNPRRRYADVKGRSIPARYLKGLPKKLQEKRIKELGRSRDAYKRGDYSELPTDKAARKLGLVKQSAYSVVAEKRGIEWRGNAKDMARRVLKHYGVTASGADLEHMVDGIQRAYNKGLAAWKSGGHRPGATATNWAVARVASLVVGGKAAFTADKKEFSWFPAALQKKILSKQSAVLKELEKQGRKDDVSFLTQARKKM